MNLLHFAYKNEAQVFLESNNYKGINSPVGKLYKSENDYILISKEGIFNALKSLSWTLSIYKDIEYVFNMGVAGALDSKIPLNAILKIKTVYGQLKDSPEFASHSFIDGEINCISSLSKVLDEKSAKNLSIFAPLVDCELWGVAEACKIYNMPLKSFKMISDYAGYLTNCDEVKSNSLFYSKALYDYFLINNNMDSNSQSEKEVILPEGFYFTDALKIQFQSKLKKTTVPNELIKNIKKVESNEKKRTLILLNEMDFKTDPIKATSIKKLQTLLKEFNLIGAKTSFDPKLEKEGFNISMNINSHKNIENLKQALDKISYIDIENIINGNFDV